MSKPWVNGVLKKWTNDIPENELYELIVHEEQSVCCIYGRHAHSSGFKKVSWEEFLTGEMNELVVNTMGKRVLSEVATFICQHRI